MNTKLVSIVMLVLVVVSFSGVATAADTIALTGMDPNKSTGNEGVVDTNKANTEAICIDKNGHVSFGQVVTQTPGTEKIPRADAMKTAIVQNYNSLNGSSGKDLQYVMWAFSGDVKYKDLTPTQKAMYDAAINGRTPDHYELYMYETVKTGTSTTTETVEVDRTATSSEVVTSLGNDTNVTTVVTDDKKTITTIVTEHFNRQVTTITEVVYATTTTVTDFYTQTMTKLVFDFSHFKDGKNGVQDLLFFKVIKTVEVEQFSNPISDIVLSTETITEVTNTPFETETVSTVEEIIKKDVPVVTPVAEVVAKVTPKTITMENTGNGVAALVIAIVVILAGLGFEAYRRRV